MGRAPCCDKMGLKKGPWTPEEDQLLISYIQQNGHANWRALPKQAGLLRCGKSCRLRWINYLRPDIKRGNFSKEEEDTIIHLHQLLGNRWSAMAAKLPGRTDNEIKNVWHTHIKKKLGKSKCQVVNSVFSTCKEIDSFGSQNSSELSSPICSSVATTSNIVEQEQLKFLEMRTADQDLKRDEGMDFWYDLFKRAENLSELPDF